MDHIATRLYVEDTLAEGQALELGPDRAHFLRSVLRLKPGARLAVFNGADGEWQAQIETLGKKQAGLSVLEQTRPPQPEPDLWLAFAPIKRGPIDFLVEKATELGVSVLQPVLTKRTNVARVNLDRLVAHTREAAEQCERLSLPAVREPLGLGQFIAGWPPERRLLVCAEFGKARPIAQVLRDLLEAAGPVAGPPPLGIMTGPEGGYDQSELDALKNLPFVTPVGLGPRLLRADTAAIAALATCQALCGDGASRPPDRG